MGEKGDLLPPVGELRQGTGGGGAAVAYPTGFHHRKARFHGNQFSGDAVDHNGITSASNFFGRGASLPHCRDR